MDACVGPAFAPPAIMIAEHRVRRVFARLARIFDCLDCGGWGHGRWFPNDAMASQMNTIAAIIIQKVIQGWLLINWLTLSPPRL